MGWVALGEALGDDDGCEAARAMGEAIVGCEEMRAIKDALRHLSGCHSTPQIDVLRLLGVPDAAIEWVLSCTDVAVADDQRQVMCGDRVLAGQWSWRRSRPTRENPFSWVVIDGINVPQTHAITLAGPVDNPGVEPGGDDIACTVGQRWRIVGARPCKLSTCCTSSSRTLLEPTGCGELSDD